MRISDWSSDVCSSDLLAGPAPQVKTVVVLTDLAVAKHEPCLNVIDHGIAGLAEQVSRHPVGTAGTLIAAHVIEGQGKILGPGGEHAPHRSDDGRVVEEWVRTCRLRVWPNY